MFASAMMCVDPFSVSVAPGICGAENDTEIGAVAVATVSRSQDKRRGCMITTGLPPRPTSTLRTSCSTLLRNSAAVGVGSNLGREPLKCDGVLTGNSLARRACALSKQLVRVEGVVVEPVEVGPVLTQ
jgi:hypothetical protein